MGAFMSITRRQFLAASAALGTLAARNVGAEAGPGPGAPPLLLDDASGLNPTPVYRQASFGSVEQSGVLRDIRAMLDDAGSGERPVAVGGARHSMGGQSLPRDGFAAALSSAAVAPDVRAKTYRVSAGARWRDVIHALDPIGFSPAVTQSNHDFSIGGTLSVNAHGWPVPSGPFGSTVRSFRLMLADGSIMTCSREENAELFRLAVGGYGLFGIILDAELRMVENCLLQRRSELMPADLFGPRFVARATGGAACMCYGRLSMARGNFLGEALLVDYTPVQPRPDHLPPPGNSTAFEYLSRSIFRAQIGSNRGKELRWAAESRLMPKLDRITVTRNTLLNQPVAALRDHVASRTDILHEYFVPPDRLPEFLAGCREIIPAHRQDLLNVSLRYVDTDTSSVLAYAPALRIAAVMLFVQ